MSKVIPLASLRTKSGSSEFEGRFFGSEVCFIVIDSQARSGPALHKHPYSETFVVLEGTALFQIGEDEVRASGGSVVVVPPGVPHRFENVGPGRLLQIDIHGRAGYPGTWGAG